MRKKIKVYCGKSVEKKCGKQLHPVSEVQRALALVVTKKDEVAYSNNPDFVMATKYIAIKHDVEAEFFLDGVSHGDDVEPIFKDFNIALDLINTLGATKE